MRVTYRSRDNKDYWEKRWSAIPADEPMENEDAYPLRYALMATGNAPKGWILEAGCGAGRLLRYYHALGAPIRGFDFIPSVVDKLKKADPSLDVTTGDICSLDYPDESFSHVLAFGLYHNLPPDMLGRALLETRRVLKPGGVLCASFRADNMTTRVTDWLRQRETKSAATPDRFHKLNLSEAEFRAALVSNGFTVDSMHYVVNMPVLYKFRFFRHATHKTFDEHKMRLEGCRLNLLGALLQSFLLKFAPSQYCNIYVALARRAKGPSED
ncbi:class I SAM-dependent methyltransferase [Nitratidesulfovibrio sp. HK-II]|jgi:SAM-dependent methyltransferase|uniref:class I SAM-dependent methyltransferase n=1 Tax=Nitratidesulfovibrio sp. HK-II TaxID=2009266 RepID=UPI000E2FB54D|nr:class I SAM-dependent methyltransferase [Nitratidesulfovibrio sp. HK-II]GBO97676.1 methyltransferase [Nitratidesulfovibrio sp. HK-II]